MKAYLLSDASVTYLKKKRIIFPDMDNLDTPVRTAQEFVSATLDRIAKNTGTGKTVQIEWAEASADIAREWNLLVEA